MGLHAVECSGEIGEQGGNLRVIESGLGYRFAAFRGRTSLGYRFATRRGGTSLWVKVLGNRIASSAGRLAGSTVLEYWCVSLHCCETKCKSSVLGSGFLLLFLFPFFSSAFSCFSCESTEELFDFFDGSGRVAVTILIPVLAGNVDEG